MQGVHIQDRIEPATSRTQNGARTWGGRRRRAPSAGLDGMVRLDAFQ